MSIARFSTAIRQVDLLHHSKIMGKGSRSATTTKHGIILPEPQKTPLGILKIIFTVIPGLLIGAGISKHIANFLEENDLFVPSDDDDDD